MGQVNVRVNGYSHTIGCKDGEEDHLQELTAQIEEKVRVIRSMGGQLSESRMLLHVALLFADEANDLRMDLLRLRREMAHNAAQAPGLIQLPPNEADPLLAERLTRIAERIEGLAQHLEKE